MPSAALSLQCAQIFWTPSSKLVEYQCAFCLKAFLQHFECLGHLKHCPKNGTNIFDSFPIHNGFGTDLNLSQQIFKLEPMDPEIEASEKNLMDNQFEVVLLEHSYSSGIENADESSIANQEEINLKKKLNSISADDTFGDSISRLEWLHDYDIDEGLFEYIPVFPNSSETPTKHVENALCPSTNGNPQPLCELDCSDVSTETAKSEITTYKYEQPCELASMYLSDLLTNPITELTCDICGKVLRSRHGMVAHMEDNHSGNALSQCRYCPKKYAQRFRHLLPAHENSHLVQYQCEYCGKVCGDRNNFQQHIRVHTGEKPFVCEFCDKAFNSRISRQVHMRLHTGYRPYKCFECPREFYANSHLRRHSRMHTGDRVTFKCDQCEKCFLSRSSLKEHLRSHTGEQPYECEVCGKRFARKYTCSNHMNTHTGKSPFACKHCARLFHSSSARRAHEKGVHKIT